MLGLGWITRSTTTLLLVLLGMAIALAGAWFAVTQHVAIATWSPTPAEVTRAEVKPVERRKRRSSRTYTVYIPRVAYRYDAKGGTYTGTDLTYLPPVNEGLRDQRAAYAWIAGLSPGASVTAYVDPDDPTRAFLRTTAQGWPFWMLVGGVALACAGAWSFVLGRSTRVAMPTLVPETSPPLFHLPIPRPMQDRAAAAITTGGVGLLVTLASVPQVLVLQVDDVTRVGAPGAGALASLATLGLGVWAWRAWRTFQDPRVLLAGNAIALGSPAVVVVEQPVRVGARVDDVLVGLICTRSVATRNARGRRTISRVVEHETWASLIAPGAHEALPQGLSIATHNMLRGAVRLDAPSTRSPTTPPDREGNRVDWMIVVTAKIAGDADASAKLPVLVVEPDMMATTPPTITGPQDGVAA